MQRLKYLTISFILAALLFAAGGASSHAMALPGAFAPSLGSAQSFAVLASSTATNTGATDIIGDLGVSTTGGSVTGFPPGTVTGTIHAGDVVAAQAQGDVTPAYNALAGQACNVNLTGQDLGGKTLAPGVYCFTSSAHLSGTLFLDAQGNPRAVWVFQIASTLVTATSASVVVIKGGHAGNVFWQVGSSATLGTGTAFKGNILAYSSITLVSGASLFGRALAQRGAVTMDTNSVAIANTLFGALLPVIKRSHS
jgi:hypothetical protein